MCDFKTELSMCSKCRLRHAAVPISGRGNADNPLIMFVGESPGRTEERTGKPFVGTAGKIFQRWVNALGLTEDDYYVSNSVKCRPPDNRSPNREEREKCEEWLFREIELVNPQIVVAMGRIAMFSLRGKRGYFTMRSGRPIFTMYHPMASLYDSNKQDSVDAHLVKLKTFINLYVQKDFDMNEFLKEEEVDMKKEEKRRRI